jgi:hypothetical protein
LRIGTCHELDSVSRGTQSTTVCALVNDHPPGSGPNRYPAGIVKVIAFD